MGSTCWRSWEQSRGPTNGSLEVLRNIILTRQLGSTAFNPMPASLVPCDLLPYLVLVTSAGWHDAYLLVTIISATGCETSLALQLPSF
jgi:hypothetical protein